MISYTVMQHQPASASIGLSLDSVHSSLHNVSGFRSGYRIVSKAQLRTPLISQSTKASHTLSD